MQASELKSALKKWLGTQDYDRRGLNRFNRRDDGLEPFLLKMEKLKNAFTKGKCEAGYEMRRRIIQRSILDRRVAPEGKELIDIMLEECKALRELDHKYSIPLVGQNTSTAGLHLVHGRERTVENYPKPYKPFTRDPRKRAAAPSASQIIKKVNTSKGSKNSYTHQPEEGRPGGSLQRTCY